MASERLDRVDNGKFEEMLESGEHLAESFRNHSIALQDLAACKERLEEAQRALDGAENYSRQTARAYEDAKVALIGSVEAL